MYHGTVPKVVFSNHQLEIQGEINEGVAYRASCLPSSVAVQHLAGYQPRNEGYEGVYQKKLVGRE